MAGHASSGAQGRGAPGQAAPGQGPAAARGTAAGVAADGSSGRGAQAMGGAWASPRRGRPRLPAALFDFSFTSFVTTRIIKVLYVLILVLVSLSWLFYTIIAFRLSAVFGLLVFVIIGARCSSSS